MSSIEPQNEEKNSSEVPANSNQIIKTNKSKEAGENPTVIISEQKEYNNIDKLVVDLQHSVFSTLNLFIVVSLAFFISYVYRQIIQPFVERTNLKYTYSMAEESRIESILAQIMAISKSDRVVLFEFHNGDKSKGGRHLNRVSATQEITGPGLTRISSKYQGLLVSNLHGFLIKLEQEACLYTDVDLIKDNYCKSHFIEHGVEFCITHGFFEAGVPLGTIQIQYCSNQREDFDNFKPAQVDKLLSELESLVRREKKTWLGEVFKLFSRRIV
jgi:hypothetical protein